MPLRRISVFFVTCLIVYGLLVVPWPGVMDAYRAAFRATGNVLFQRFGAGGAVRLEPLASHDHAKDTTLKLRKLGPPVQRAEFDIKSVYAGYRPTAFFIALVVATPIAWRRKWRAMLIGLILVSAFVAGRVSLLLLDAFSNPDPLALYAPSAFWKGSLRVGVILFYHAPEMHYVVPTVVWMTITFRHEDLRVILTRNTGTTLPTNARRRSPRDPSPNPSRRVRKG